MEKNKDYKECHKLIRKLSNKPERWEWWYGGHLIEKQNIHKKFDKNIAKENLLDIKKIFDENNLFFYLANGTLLGAVRDNDFIEYENLN